MCVPDGLMMGEGGVLGVYLTVCCWEKVGILFRRELETGYRCKVKQISFPLGFPNFSLLIFLCFICEKKILHSDLLSHIFTKIFLRFFL